MRFDGVSVCGRVTNSDEFDATGRVVWHERTRLRHVSGAYVYSVNTGHWAGGVYVIRVSLPGMSRAVRFSVLR